MTNVNKKLSAVLFDLDGTMLDTAPDLANAFNQLRISHDLDPLPMDLIRSYAGTGSKELLKLSFNIDDHDERMHLLLKKYYDFYEQNLFSETKLFHGISHVLNYLSDLKLPWGIVTNKVSRFTKPLAQHFNLNTDCIVCSDTLNILKPDPAPLLYACQQLNVAPEDVIYVGDTKIDVDACKAAGMPCAVALYGYLSQNADPQSWDAEFYLPNAQALIPVINQFLFSENIHEKIR